MKRNNSEKRRNEEREDEKREPNERCKLSLIFKVLNVKN